MPHATRIADPFHAVKLANSTIGDMRRRPQNHTTGGRGTKRGPLYRTRLLLQAAERISVRGRTKMCGLLAAGDPRGEVRDAWHAKETLRGIYRIPNRDLALGTLDEPARDMQDDTFSPELNKLSRTLRSWRTQIANWHRSRVTNGPTETANNLAKLIKRVSFGNRQPRPLPHPNAAARRQTRLDPPRQPHSTPKREEPLWGPAMRTGSGSAAGAVRTRQRPSIGANADSAAAYPSGAVTASPIHFASWAREGCRLRSGRKS